MPARELRAALEMVGCPDPDRELWKPRTCLTVAEAPGLIVDGETLAQEMERIVGQSMWDAKFRDQWVGGHGDPVEMYNWLRSSGATNAQEHPRDQLMRGIITGKKDFDGQDFKGEAFWELCWPTDGFQGGTYF